MGIFNGLKKIDFDKIKKIHFIGIGGIGISAISKLMLAQGKKVSGSDLGESDITAKLEKMGAKIFIGQKKENVPKDADLAIYTPAIAYDNVEMIASKENRIPLMSYPEALGFLLNDKFGVAVCGTHGKSTVTSMVGLVLAGGGLDPSVVVGSKVPEFDGNLRIGNSINSEHYFIAEACEYKRDFLEYYPKIIVLNNIELDHTDYYKDIADFRSAFEEFIGHLPDNGVLILNGDDKQVESLKLKVKSPNAKLKIIQFGLGENNDVRGYDFKTENGKTKFKVNYRDKDLGEFVIKLPGKFNVYNALAAIATGLHLKIDAEKIKKSLADFGGIWRRFEIKGEYRGATVISDYAHHPTAVRSTIEAAREFYPERRIVAVFQPHQHNRTKMLYDDFLKSFDSANVLVLAKIFDVAGREEKKDQNVSSQRLAEDIKAVIARSEATKQSLANARLSNKLRDCHAPTSGARNDNNNVFLQSDSIFYAKNLDEVRKLIDEKIKPGDVLLIMGAGDIYKVADELVKK
ncbi:MAG: UDP-N-acetylmuramate--L-alanine ligase [bacterium]|nr:UDP-N-acetylmuramate--L-alanine ligase [bacterium]